MSITRGPGRPKQYLTTSGRKVPGVTTILEQFKDSKALIGWANKIGLGGMTLKDARDGSLGTGSLLHEAIEDHLEGFEPDELLADNEEARSCFDGYLQFREVFDGEFVEVEIPLVSDRYEFGGTIDAICTWRGQPIVLDWKSSRASVRFTKGYAEHLIQLGGYAQLWWEHRGEVFDSAHVVYLIKPDPIPTDRDAQFKQLVMAFRKGDRDTIRTLADELITEVGPAMFKPEKPDAPKYLWKTYDRQQLKLAHEQFLAFRECYERGRQLKDAVKEAS